MFIVNIFFILDFLIFFNIERLGERVGLLIFVVNIFFGVWVIIGIG